MTRRKRSSPDDDDIEDENLSSSVENSTPDPQNDNDDMKTHYYITPKVPGDPSMFYRLYCRLTNQTVAQVKHESPFLTLFNGKEPTSNAQHRFKSYNRVWQHQLAKIQSILDNANDDLFQDLVKFINLGSFNKLSVGYVQLTSNTANNLRILQEFYGYLDKKEGFDYKLITLNSKNFAYNIKTTLRDIVKQFNESFDKPRESYRLNYDLDTIADWYGQEELRTTKIVLVLEDTNLINNQLLNQLLKVLQAYVGRIPLKILMALSCDTVSSWTNSNLTNDLRMSIEGYKFKSNDNKSLGYIILNNLFLTPELTPENPLLINSTLSTIILNRFENSNNSVDALIAEIKLCYMIYFYQLPLSILIDSEPLTDIYIDGLRKLPSFKKYVELKLHQDDPVVVELLKDNEAVIKLFHQARLNFRKFKLAVMNAINIIYQLHPNKPKQKFELYKLLINHKLLNSKYLFESIKNLSKLSHDVLERVIVGLTDNCKEVVGDIRDEHLIRLIKELSTLENLHSIQDIVQNYLDNQVLSLPLDYFVFHEVFTLDGGIISEKHGKVQLEENYENLMSSLIQAELRGSIERGLNQSESYLANDLINVDKTCLPPVLCHIFKLYKEAPSKINMLDFYLAFKSTLDMQEYCPHGQDWDKVTYAWFLQAVQELNHIGLLHIKTDGLEKTIWKGV
ncbi:Origin recognition complex subunit 3 [Candida viswanathii]|uniref:Origin recognition complex subunit 3 n=1 Tax=Candida viswanathii TaxID=5486 RepID=A0A367XM20_9ASCO|nr:Origin recognition complex subunit 3 [Candida viswanathii]